MPTYKFIPSCTVIKFWQICPPIHLFYHFWRTSIWMYIAIVLNQKHQGTIIKQQMDERRGNFMPLLELVCHFILYSTISVFIYGITIWMIAYWGFENKQMELREWNIWISNPLWTNTELKQAFVDEANNKDEKEWLFITRYNKYFYL